MASGVRELREFGISGSVFGLRGRWSFEDGSSCPQVLAIYEYF